MVSHENRKSEQRPQDLNAIAGARILLVEDNEINQQVAGEILEGSGFLVTIANNGLEAVEQVQSSQFDVVLMDIVMPEINGFQATRYLTRQPDTRHIPIVIISGSDQMSDKAWGLKLGARDYLSKPVDKKQLLLTIARVLDEVAMQVPEPEPVVVAAQAS